MRHVESLPVRAENAHATTCSDPAFDGSSASRRKKLQPLGCDMRKDSAIMATKGLSRQASPASLAMPVSKYSSRETVDFGNGAARGRASEPGGLVSRMGRCLFTCLAPEVREEDRRVQRMQQMQGRSSQSMLQQQRGRADSGADGATSADALRPVGSRRARLAHAISNDLAGHLSFTGPTQPRPRPAKTLSNDFVADDDAAELGVHLDFTSLFARGSR